MARQSTPETVSRDTQVDLTATDYRFVEQRAGEAGIRLCRQQQLPCGVMITADNANVAQVVEGPGRVKITAGEALTQGALVTTDALGRAVLLTHYGAGDWVLGRVEEVATAAGDIITFEYFGPGARGATD